jgi:hypothetical protein
MNWAWAASVDQIWHSPGFPMWLTLAAAGFFAVILLVTLLHAEKSVANGALAVITLLAIGIAGAATLRSFGPDGQETSAGVQSSPPPQQQMASLPALSCVDDMAGEAVLTACEKALFGSPENTATALAYAASQITRLTVLGDVAAANKDLTPELQMLRHAVEHDRYGLMAYVLQTRDHCTPANCAAFRSLTDRRQIAANMDARTYDGLVARYALQWNAPPPIAPPMSVPLAALGASVPTGKPTTADFPTAASTPAVSIMTPEPGTPPASRPPVTASQASAPLPSQHPPAAPAPAAAKKQAASKSSHASAPVQLAPAAAAPTAAAPAAGAAPVAND